MARFAMLWVETGNASEAYRQAYSATGMAAATVNKEAAKLLRHPLITPIVDRLKQELAEKHGITREWLATQLKNIVAFDIRDVMKWNGLETIEQDNPNGGEVLVHKHIYTNEVLLKNSDALNDATALAIAEVTMTAQGVRVKPYDKIDAADKLARLVGFFEEQPEKETTIIIRDMRAERDERSKGPRK